MKKTSQKALFSAIVAGILAMGTSSSYGDGQTSSTTIGADGSAQYECKGGNACKGKGDCGGKGHSCAGSNECRRKGYVLTDSEDECKALNAKLDAEDAKKKKAKKGAKRA